MLDFSQTGVRINQAAAWLKMAAAWSIMQLPDFTMVAAWSIRQLPGFDQAAAWLIRQLPDFYQAAIWPIRPLQDFVQAAAAWPIRQPPDFQIFWFSPVTLVVIQKIRRFLKGKWAQMKFRGYKAAYTILLLSKNFKKIR